MQNTSTTSLRRIIGGSNGLVRPGHGEGSLQTGERTLAGFEAMAMIRRGKSEI
jgi:hypothetical protein